MSTLHEICRRHYGGRVTRMADDFGFLQSHLRRLMLPPGHAEHIGPSEPVVRKLYVKSGGRITPNDLYALPRVRRTEVASRLRAGPAPGPKNGRAPARPSAPAAVPVSPPPALQRKARRARAH